MNFIFEEQKIKNVFLITPQKYTDERGFFVELFKKDLFENHNIKFNFIQENFSYSKHKTLRGLHFQKDKFSQDKLISVQYGEIIDIIVDLRKNSETFGKYLKFNLSHNKPQLLYIPKGFAHGFVCISEFACLNYKTSEYYNKKADSGIIWNDKTLNIDWEIDFEPILSEKDKILPNFNKNNIYF